MKKHVCLVLFFIVLGMPGFAYTMSDEDQEKSNNFLQELKNHGLTDDQIEEVVQNEIQSRISDQQRVAAYQLSRAIFYEQSDEALKRYLNWCNDKNKTNHEDSRLILKTDSYTGFTTCMSFYPLIFTVKHSKTKALTCLIQEGCNVNIIFPEIDNNNLLYFVRTPQIFKELVQHKINVFHRNKLKQLAFSSILLTKRNKEWCLQIGDQHLYSVLKKMVKACGYESVPELKKVLGTIEKTSKKSKLARVEVKNMANKLIVYLYSQKTKVMGRRMVALKNNFIDLVFEF